MVNGPTVIPWQLFKNFFSDFKCALVDACSRLIKIISLQPILNLKLMDMSLLWSLLMIYPHHHFSPIWVSLNRSSFALKYSHLVLTFCSLPICFEFAFNTTYQIMWELCKPYWCLMEMWVDLGIYDTHRREQRCRVTSFPFTTHHHSTLWRYRNDVGTTKEMHVDAPVFCQLIPLPTGKIGLILWKKTDSVHAE